MFTLEEGYNIVGSFVCRQHGAAISIIQRRLLLGMAQNQYAGTSGEPAGMIHGRSFQQFLTMSGDSTAFISLRIASGARSFDFERAQPVSHREQPYYTIGGRAKVGRGSFQIH